MAGIHAAFIFSFMIGRWWSLGIVEEHLQAEAPVSRPVAQYIFYSYEILTCVSVQRTHMWEVAVDIMLAIVEALVLQVSTGVRSL